MLKQLFLSAGSTGNILPVELVNKLTPADGSSNYEFGLVVSATTDGSTLLVGAPGRRAYGGAYVFTKNEYGLYQELQTLIASDGAANDYFGGTVSISGDGNTILIGAAQDDDKGSNSGSAYIFTKQADGTYSQTQKLVATDGAANAYFGASGSLSNDGSIVLIGISSVAGGAYVFSRNTSGLYSQIQKIIGNYNANFGTVSISPNGKFLAVGGTRGAGVVAGAGFVDIYGAQDDGSYTLSQRIFADDGVNGDMFGISAGISNDGDIVVGTIQGADVGADGAIYIFKKQTDNTYIQSQKLVSGIITSTGDQFGRSISITDNGDTILVTAIQGSGPDSTWGTAYVFTKSDSGSYSRAYKLFAEDGSYSDQYGISGTISGDGGTILIGANRDNDIGTASGSAYVYA